MLEGWMAEFSIRTGNLRQFWVSWMVKMAHIAKQCAPKRSDWTQVSHRVAHPLLRYELSTADSVSGKNSEKAVPLLPGRVVLDTRRSP